MKHVVVLGLASQQAPYDEIIDFGTERVRVSFYGTNFDHDLTSELIKKYDGLCDAICLNGLPPRLKYKGGVFHHPQVYRFKSLAINTPIVDGGQIKETLLPWLVRQLSVSHGSLVRQKRVGFYQGGFLRSLVEVFSDISAKTVLADPYSFMRLPFNLKGPKQIDNFIRFLWPVFSKLPIKRSTMASFDNELVSKSPHLREFFDCDIFVANESTFHLINLGHLKNKIVVTDFLSAALKDKLCQAGVRKVIVLMPMEFALPFVNLSVIEGLILATRGEKAPLRESDILDWMNREAPMARVYDLEPASADSANKFAFIIHPLSRKYLFKHPLLKPFANVLKPVDSSIEDAISLSSGFFWGKIKGVKSEYNGREVEGLIYTVTETPRKLLEQDPQVIYRKLTDLAIKARDEGAQIIGLGAYTKIVGDAGVSVAQMSPIPVTTGNSLSACSTLWAAKLAVDKLGFVKFDNGIMQGRAMVIGATGSIGAVSAKILARGWKSVVLVAPRAYKLLELKAEIEEIAPECEIIVSTKPDEYTPSCDLIITTTSAQGERILSIDKVRAGAVICDVSRPFDISESEAMGRPDVMVIASGEVTLPGNPDIQFDMGLEGNAVYACLAETALLALEGRYESFTLSRKISYQKVLEIDLMAAKHGVRLATIMGHHGAVTDEEYQLCREHALAKMAQHQES